MPLLLVLGIVLGIGALVFAVYMKDRTEFIPGGEAENSIVQTHGDGLVEPNLGEEQHLVDGQEESQEGVEAPDSAPEEALTGEARDNQADVAAAEKRSEEAAVDESVILLFGGDVYLSDHVLSAYDQNGGIGGVLDQGYRRAIAEANFFIVNEEFPFSSRGTPAEDKQYTFRLAPERVRLFQEMGIDLVTLANNHALDYGVDALLDTIDILDGAGILHVGAGENLAAAAQPVILEASGKRIGVIGASRVVPEVSWGAGKEQPGMLLAYDSSQLLEEIRSTRETTDFLVVYLHWGVEREDTPKDYQRELGRACIDAGADLVIGSHPHVLQGIEYYNGKPIVYSLGNFVFGSSIPKTMLLEVTWSGDALQLRLLPGTSGSGYTRMLTDSEKIEAFYREMEALSEGIEIGVDGTVSEKGT